MSDDPVFRRTSDVPLPHLAQRLLSSDRVSLAKAITLLESKRPDDQKKAGELMELILPHTGKSFRIGISGAPGAGKSTFIEAFGKYLTSHGHKVAVLSVDPSSSKTRGSILGDKTRMAELSKDPQAFIRPSAAGDALGGVASNTRETILLCEAAGYEIVIVETVGVGQNETLVKEMVDYFLLLMLAGGGDELQGIKRGIMEMADHLLINKADGDNLKRAKQAKGEFAGAIHLFPPHEAGWSVPVGLCSAQEKKGIEDTWKQMCRFQKLSTANGWIHKNRQHQLLQWFHQSIRQRLEATFFAKEEVKQKIKKKEALIASQRLSVRKAVDELF